MPKRRKKKKKVIIVRLTDDQRKRILVEAGRKGGLATGASKVRGDSGYYAALVAKREAKRKAKGETT